MIVWEVTHVCGSDDDQSKNSMILDNTFRQSTVNEIKTKVWKELGIRIY